MESKICTECGTENSPDYKYCKNCGAILNKPEQKPEGPEFIGGSDNREYNSQNTESRDYGERHESYSQTGVSYQPSNWKMYPDFSIDGVPCDDITAYIGKEAPKIMPKFIKMELTRTKTSWCWPAAVLSFLFGPLGAAIWFLYRKMYKPALILIAIGLVLTASVKALTYDIDEQGLASALSGSIENGSLDDLLKTVSELPTADLIRISISSLLQQTANIIAMVITGIFGYYIYKKQAIAKIITYRSSQVDPRYYRIGLASVGGTSGGMLAVGIFMLIAIKNIIDVIFTYVSMI